ncbi:flavin reductase family protein [Pyrofollis japonicus]|uniref:flavin reductase family protein n=1 Tax=Pyrofollis japonicus TaxID=3060460 RepID=UPI00295C3A2C|nr:flavin reductase family protein [Pyrofollis japonicus]BEP16660.1 flavin reductase family protein [Pyrofollis japonicus]
MSAPKGYIDAGKKWYYVLHPRPVYVVAAEHNGRINFMAASWIMPLSEEPARIVAALDKEAYTTELVLGAGVFTVNVLSVEHVEFIYGAGTMSGRKVDKIRVLGAELARDTVTGAPRLVKPRPLGVIEAQVHRSLEDVAEDVYLVVADVVAAYADAELFNPRYGWELKKVRVAMHSAGRAFTTNNGLYVAKKKGS